MAIAGRSNVGKSSLINSITGHRALARTSADPGRTRLVNFFAIAMGSGKSAFEIRLVDLPGYGYAKVSRAARAAWRPLIESYLAGRASLRAVILLVDARRGAEEEEGALLEYVAALGRPLIVVATKIDKIGRTQRGKALVAIAGRLPGTQPIAFSAASGEGRELLWRALRRVCGGHAPETSPARRPIRP